MIIMKKLTFVILLLSTALFAQFKEGERKPDIKDGLITSDVSGFFLDFLSSDKFQMNHSVGMSYSSFGNQGYALGVYTNSMSFAFTDNLSLNVDASLVNSPYSTYGDEFSKSVNGVYLSRVQLNYKPADNMFVVFQYRNIPASGYYNYNRGYYRNSFFDFE